MQNKTELPKVKIEIGKLDEYIGILHHFLNPSKGD